MAIYEVGDPGLTRLITIRGGWLELIRVYNIRDFSGLAGAGKNQ
jgi:hypothetical protein